MFDISPKAEPGHIYIHWKIVWKNGLWKICGRFTFLQFGKDRPWMKKRIFLVNFSMLKIENFMVSEWYVIMDSVVFLVFLFLGAWGRSYPLSSPWNFYLKGKYQHWENIPLLSVGDLRRESYNRCPTSADWWAKTWGIWESQVWMQYLLPAPDF